MEGDDEGDTVAFSFLVDRAQGATPTVSVSTLVVTSAGVAGDEPVVAVATTTGGEMGGTCGFGVVAEDDNVDVTGVEGERITSEEAVAVTVDTAGLTTI